MERNEFRWVVCTFTGLITAMVWNFGSTVIYGRGTFAWLSWFGDVLPPFCIGFVATFVALTVWKAINRENYTTVRNKACDKFNAWGDALLG